MLLVKEIGSYYPVSIHILCTWVCGGVCVCDPDCMFAELLWLHTMFTKKYYLLCFVQLENAVPLFTSFNQPEGAANEQQQQIPSHVFK